MAPFRVQIPQSAIDDLQRRLRDIRWPDRETVAPLSQGVPLDAARTLSDRWGSGYDWRAFEGTD
jgi:hypothetical protein